MSELFQQAIVGVVVFGAGAFVVRRVVQALRPAAGSGPCPSCASGSTACHDKAAASTPLTGAEVKPLVLMRTKPR